MDTCSNGLYRDALKLATNELLYSSYATQTNRAWIMQHGAPTFSYSNHVWQVLDWILFSNIWISRKSVFVFVSELSEFDFVFVFKCETENINGVIPAEFDRFTLHICIHYVCWMVEPKGII
jgi:hypothetical protein